MPTVIGSATIRILPNSAGFSAALQSQLRGATGAIQGSLKGATGGVAGLSAKLGGMADNMGRVSNRLILTGQAMTYSLTRPIIEAGAAIIAVSADFDEAARTVAAITIPNPIGDEWEGLDDFDKRVDQFKESAQRIAKTTVFSSVEIQKAYVDLARAGLTTADQLESVIGTVANVALVEGGKMEDFSDKLVQIFTGFGGNFEEIGGQYKTIFGDVRATTGDLTAEFEHMGDILALTSQRTVTDINDLAVAFRYAGPTAKAAGLSFEETAAGLGLLAQAGFSGSMGGTALRGIISRLAIPTKLSTAIFEKFGMTMETAFQPENAAKLQDSLNALGTAQEDIDDIMAGGFQSFKASQDAVKGYGFAVFDAAGNMKPLVDIVQEFVDKGARVGDIGKVFGQRAGPAFQGLMDNLPALKRLTVELDGAEGALGRMSERMKSSASVQFKLLKNSVTDLFVALGEGGVLKFFSDLAADLRDFVIGLKEVDPNIVRLIGTVGLLVAAMGPLRIVLGLLLDGLKMIPQAAALVLRAIMFLMTPWGALVTAVSVAVGFFALMVARSEALRDAMGYLYDVVKVAVVPIFEHVVLVFKLIIGAIAGIAKVAGDVLAPKLVEVGQLISDWIKEGGLASFLAGFRERIYDVAVALVQLVSKVEQFVENGGLTDYLETAGRVWEDFEVILREVWKTLGLVWDALQPVVTALGTTLAAGVVVVWNALKGFLGVLEGLWKLLGPIGNFLKDNLTPILAILAARFIFFGKAATAAVASLTAFSTGAINRLSSGFEKAGFAALKGANQYQKFSNFISPITDSINRFGTTIANKVPLLQRFGLGLATMGSDAQRGAGFIGKFAAGFDTAMMKLEKATRRVGKVIGPALGNIQNMMMGFFAGQMLQNADTLATKVTGIGLAITSMVASFAMAPGPIGLVLAALTGISVLIGQVVGKTDSVWKTLDDKGIIDTLRSRMEGLGRSFLTTGEAHDILARSLQALGAGNYEIIKNNVEKVGGTLDEFFKKLTVEGPKAAEDYVSGLAKVFTEKALAGELKDQNVEYRFEVSGWKDLQQVHRTTTDLRDIDRQVGDLSGITTKVWAKEMVKDGDKLKDNWKEISKDITTSEGAFELISNEYRTTFGGNIVTKFAKDYGIAREEAERMLKLTQEIKVEEDRMALASKSWVDMLGEAGQKLEEIQTKAKTAAHAPETTSPLTGFFGLIDSVQEALPQLRTAAGNLPTIDISSLFTGDISQAGAQFKNLQDLFGMDLKKALNFQKTISGLRDEYIDLVTLVRANLPMGAGLEELNGALGGVKTTMFDIFVNTFKMSKEEAQKLVDLITTIPDETIKIILDDAQAQMLLLAWKLGMEEGLQTTLFVKLTSDIPNLPEQYRIALAKIASTKTPDGKGLLFTGPNVDKFFEALKGAQVKSIEFLTAKLATMPVPDVKVALDLVATGALTADHLTALLGAGLTLPDIKTNLQILNDPAQWAKVQQLLAMGITPMQIPVYLNLMTKFPEATAGDLIWAEILAGQIKDIPLSVILGGGLLPPPPPPVPPAGSNFGGGGMGPGGFHNVVGIPVPEIAVPDDAFAKVTAELVAKAMAGGPTDIPITINPTISNLAEAAASISAQIGAAFGVSAGGFGAAAGALGGGAAPGAPGIGVPIPVTPMVVGMDVVTLQLQALAAVASAISASIEAGFTYASVSIQNALYGIVGALLQVIGTMPVMMQMASTLAGAFFGMAMSISLSVGMITNSLGNLVAMMQVVSYSLLRGFSAPFATIAARVWNPFASFINAAATAFGLGPLLPTGLSIPVFHTGGVVGDGSGDSYDGSRPMSGDEMMALLQKGEGVMSRQMMSNMTTAQITEFKKGNSRWWAVGGPYESGGARAEGRLGEGLRFNDPGNPDHAQYKAVWEGLVRPLVMSVRTTHPNNIGGNIASESMGRVGDAAVEYSRGFSDRMMQEQRAYLTSIGLPEGFNLQGALPAGFDIEGWRSFLGANKAPGNYPLLMSYLDAAGVPYLVNSTVRPGDGTSYHASGRAVDFGSPGDANFDSPGLLGINHAFAPMLGVLSELIYSGPGGISDKAYDAATMAAHHNHVHVALANGAVVKDLVYAMLGEKGPEVVLPLNDPMRALALARKSGVLRTLQQAQSGYRAPSPVSTSSDAVDADAGILSGGPGNTYHIHGMAAKEIDTKIRNRDRAAMRRRR